MLLGTLGASLLGNLLTGKVVNKKGRGIHRAGEGIVRAGEGRSSSSASQNNVDVVLEQSIFLKKLKHLSRIKILRQIFSGCMHMIQ